MVGDVAFDLAEPSKLKLEPITMIAKRQADFT